MHRVHLVEATVPSKVAVSTNFFARGVPVRVDRLGWLVVHNLSVESGAGSPAMLSSHLFIVSTESDARSAPLA